MISLLIVTKNKYQLLNEHLIKYIKYNNLDKILIFDNSSLDERINQNIFQDDKILCFNDSEFNNIGLYGGLNHLLNIAKKMDSSFFVILDDDAFMSEQDFDNINNHELELYNNVGVSLHLCDISRTEFTEPLYIKNSTGPKFLFTIDDFFRNEQPIFVESAPNIGIVVSNRLMKLVEVPKADLFFCGEAFFFDNFKKINAKLFYMNDFKVYHKKHSFYLYRIPFVLNREIKISIVSDFHDYYEIRNYLRFLKYKRNFKSLLILPLIIFIKIFKSDNKINKTITIVKSLLNIKFNLK